MARIYISSTYEDLKTCREAVYRTLRQLGHDVVAMEDYVASDVRPLDKCLEDITACDIYVGVFAQRYGFVPLDAKKNPDSRSITELEYRHAVGTGKPCLAFLLKEDARWPVKYFDNNQQARDQLSKLREELSGKHMIGFFMDENDLAKQVSVAVSNLKIALARIKAQSAPPPPAEEHSLGNLTPKLCDRERQVYKFDNAFKANLRERRGFPQIYLIRGETGECHDSLVERLVKERVRATIKENWPEEKQFDPEPKALGWAYKGEPHELRLELMARLFELDPTYLGEDSSATTLSKLPTIAALPLIVLKHDIHSESWNDRSKELLEWYLDYWAALGLDRTRPQFLIFLNVIYPKAQDVSWWKSLWSRSFDKNKVEADLKAVMERHKTNPLYLMFEELEPPARHDVEQWLKKYKICELEQNRLEIITAIFEKAPGQISMAYVEQQLCRIHEEYIRTKRAEGYVR